MSEPERRLTFKELEAENAALRARVAELEASIAASQSKAAGDLVTREAFVLKTRLSFGARQYAPGDVMPFDPKAPPPGCDGLREGVHYEKARVIERG